MTFLKIIIQVNQDTTSYRISSINKIIINVKIIIYVSVLNVNSELVVKYHHPYDNAKRDNRCHCQNGDI